MTLLSLLLSFLQMNCTDEDGMHRGNGEAADFASLLAGAKGARRPVFSGFVPVDKRADMVREAARSGLYIELWGGYPFAGRVILGVCASGPQSGIDRRILLRDATPAPALPFPIIPVRAKPLAPGTRIVRRDFAAVLAGCLCEPSAIGDTLFVENGAVVFALAAFAAEIATRLSRAALAAACADAAEYAAYEPATEFVTVAGIRLDALVASAFRLSRENAQLAVKNGYTLLNYEHAAKSAQSFAAGDVVFVSGKGRVRVVSLAETSKGRIKVGVARY